MTRSFIPILLIAAVAPAQGPPPAEDAFRLSVDLNLVALQVTVSDAKGRFAPDLAQPNFRVYEDGVPQAIRMFRHEDVPVTVGLVVDHSGSMGPKLSHVIEAARAFARSSNSRDQLFVVNFNEHVTMGMPLAKPFTNSPEELDTAISKTGAAGKTALYDALDSALDRLKSGTAEKKVLIAISDGGDNASLLGLPAILKKAETSNAVIYTIGIFDDADEDKNPAVLRRLARTTGGEAFFPTRLEEAVSICESIARDIRHQYTLAYVSANETRSGGFRKVHVTAEADGFGKLQVRTRSGYIR